MQRHTALGNLVLACALVFGAAFSCGQNNNRGSSTETNRNNNDGDLSDLPGTHWGLMSLTKKGEAEYESGTWPDVRFCKNGTWTILHYGSAGPGGYGMKEGQVGGATYQVNGSRLVMKNGDGTIYGDYRLSSRTEQEMFLESDHGYVMRLKYIDSKDCGR